MWIPSAKDAVRILSLVSNLQLPFGDDRAPSGVPDSVNLQPPELPGGSPFGLCKTSSSTDLFEITSVEIEHQPVYIDDVFLVHIYGSFQDTYKPNASISLYSDCGSHCEEYGYDPDSNEWPVKLFTENFCEFADIEQPTGGKKKDDVCKPEKGYALITMMGYVWPMFLRSPGWYNFTVDITTKDDDRVFCLMTEVCLKWRDPEKNEWESTGPWGNCSWPR